MTQILGHNYIGGERSAEGSTLVKSVDATTGETLPYDFYQATPQEVDRAATAAASAYPAFRALNAERRAEFLDAIGMLENDPQTEIIALISKPPAPAVARKVLELALLLRAGGLAAPMYFAEERTIGPSLGADNIAKGGFVQR